MKIEGYAKEFADFLSLFADYSADMKKASNKNNLSEEVTVENQQFEKLPPKASVVFEINPCINANFQDIDKLTKEILNNYSGKCEVHIKIAGLHV